MRYRGRRRALGSLRRLGGYGGQRDRAWGFAGLQIEIAAVEVRVSTIFDADESQSRTQEFFANRRRFAGFDVDTDHLERRVMVVGQQEFEHYALRTAEGGAECTNECGGGVDWRI